MATAEEKAAAKAAKEAEKAAAKAAGDSSLDPSVIGKEHADIPAGADFSFAVNKIKLSRALAYINATQPGLKGKALEAAVKERYVNIGGLLIEDKPVRTGLRRKGLSHDVEEVGPQA